MASKLLFDCFFAEPLASLFLTDDSFLTDTDYFASSFLDETGLTGSFLGVGAVTSFLGVLLTLLVGLALTLITVLLGALFLLVLLYTWAGCFSWDFVAPLLALTMVVVTLTSLFLPSSLLANLRLF